MLHDKRDRLFEQVCTLTGTQAHHIIAWAIITNRYTRTMQ